MFTLLTILKNKNSLCDYIKALNANKGKSLREWLNYARSICDGLPSEENMLAQLVSEKSAKDKGLVGKIIEYGFFGQKPNSDSSPDIIALKCDIKSCAFKLFKKIGKNAKERQTLTNVGNTKNYDSFQNILDHEHFETCSYYAKSSQFLICIRDDDKKKMKTVEELMNQPMLLIVFVELETLPLEMRTIINSDYENIRQCVLEKRVSQKGQKYLHIHTHGAGHGSGNRAFGFTSSFITRVVALQLAELHQKKLEDILIESGKSISIKHEYL
uniref:Uncharacterized protein n=1 Tax=viral metagenome TaxID=1070528 RepID=A0A6C0B9C1_9ZZZZ